MSVFTEADLDALSGLHVQRAFFAHATLPTGERRFHTGLGPKEIDGETWEGVSDPFAGQMVSVGSIEEPWFGHAPAVDVVISGANRQWLKQMWDTREALDGAPCDFYFAAFDAETGAVLVQLTPIFPGRITAPRFSFIGTVIRFIQVKVVSVFEGLNYPTTEAQWSPAGQRTRFPGDKGLDYIASRIVEFFKA